MACDTVDVELTKVGACQHHLLRCEHAPWADEAAVWRERATGATWCRPAAAGQPRSRLWRLTRREQVANALHASRGWVLRRRLGRADVGG